MPAKKKCQPPRSGCSSVGRSRRGRGGSRRDVPTPPPPELMAEGPQHESQVQVNVHCEEREECEENVASQQPEEEYCVPQPPAQEPRDDAQTPITGSGKRHKIPALLLTMEQQDSIRDWYFENECLYDKRHPQYHTVDRDMLWSQKAEELKQQGVKGITGSRLNAWVYGVRTDYSKLTKETGKSGASGIEQAKLTARMKWVLERWNFLGEHIYRRNQGGKELRASILHKYPERAQSQNTADCEEDTICEIPTQDTTQDPDNESTSSTRVNTDKRRRKMQEVKDLETIMVDYLQQTRSMQEDLRSAIRPHGTKDPEQAAFTAWFSTACAAIHPELWDQFQTDCHTLIRRYRDRTRQLQAHTSALGTTGVAVSPGLSYVSSEQQQEADYRAAWSLGSYSAHLCPQGMLPEWQYKFQPQPSVMRRMQAPPPSMTMSFRNIRPSASLGAPPADEAIPSSAPPLSADVSVTSSSYTATVSTVSAILSQSDSTWATSGLEFGRVEAVPFTTASASQASSGTPQRSSGAFDSDFSDYAEYIWTETG